jgi:hypothetical protein
VFPLMHWLVVVIIVSLINLFPISRILHRAGSSGWWCLLCYMPPLGIIGLWVFAYIRWPTLDGSAKQPTSQRP